MAVLASAPPRPTNTPGCVCDCACAYEDECVDEADASRRQPRLPPPPPPPPPPPVLLLLLLPLVGGAEKCPPPELPDWSRNSWEAAEEAEPAAAVL